MRATEKKEQYFSNKNKELNGLPGRDSETMARAWKLS